MGIRKIVNLSQVHPDMMVSVLGKNGLVLLNKAKGIDHSPVVPYIEQRSIGTQSTFKADTIDVEAITKC